MNNVVRKWPAVIDFVARREQRTGGRSTGLALSG